MSSDLLNLNVEILAMPPQEQTIRLAEQRDAAAYVARNARDDADRDLLLAVLGLAAASAGLLVLGHHISQGGSR